MADAIMPLYIGGTGMSDSIYKLIIDNIDYIIITGKSGSISKSASFWILIGSLSDFQPLILPASSSYKYTQMANPITLTPTSVSVSDDTPLYPAQCFIGIVNT